MLGDDFPGKIVAVGPSKILTVGPSKILAMGPSKILAVGPGQLFHDEKISNLNLLLKAIENGTIGPLSD